MKIRFALLLISVITVAGCKTAPPPMTDDTLVNSTVNGVTLLHRHAVQTPGEFTPVNETWRALYNASVMTTPDYSGRLVGHLENGKLFLVLGKVENGWLAIAGPAGSEETQLIGYAPPKAGVSSERYVQTLRNDRPRPRRSTHLECVDVGGASKACRSHNTATWILD